MKSGNDRTMQLYPQDSLISETSSNAFLKKILIPREYFQFILFHV